MIVGPDLNDPVLLQILTGLSRCGFLFARG
jgi:hypothetical protein